MNLSKRGTGAYLALSLAFIALGVCLIAWPSASAQTICAMAGGVVALIGLVKLVGYFSRKRSGLAFQFDFALGVVCTVLGLTIIAFARSIVGAIPVFLGIFILVDGIFKLQTAFDAKRVALPGWWGILLVALAVCAAGVFLIVKRYESAATMAVILGIALLVDGVQNLIVAIYAIRKERKSAIVVDYREVEE